jgi:hypothetical protein
MVVSSPYCFTLSRLYMFHIHVYCFVCNHEFILYVLSYYIITCLMSVHASNMLYLFVLILQPCCLCCYLFIFNCSVSLYAYYIYMINMFYVLMIYIVMDIFDITISMINHLLYVIIIMLIYGIKMICKMPIILIEYPSHVYKLSKMLYGLKQAPRAWYECLRDFFITSGFKVGKTDPTLFTKTIVKDLFICQIYVDDIIFWSTNKSSCEKISRIMIQKFEMFMMGELKYFLGFEIKQLQEVTFISQTKYIQDIIKKFRMKNDKPIKITMGRNGHLDLDTGGKYVDQKVYRLMIRSLLYLCDSQPDIMFLVCLCARLHADPKKIHLKAVKRIMRYLVYTPKFGLCYPKRYVFDLIDYSDANYVE